MRAMKLKVALNLNNFPLIRRKNFFSPDSPSSDAGFANEATSSSINEMKTFFGEVEFAFETKAKLCMQEEARLRANPTVELIRKSLCGP